MTEEKKIQVVDRATGKTRLADRAATKPELINSVPAEVDSMRAAVLETTPRAAGGTTPETHSDLSPILGDNISAELPYAKTERKKGKKKKAEIDTLEQFITHAFALKGRRVSLSNAVERRIGHQPKLEEDALQRLRLIASADALFAVPRQLLLVSREIQTYPSLRGAIRDFVKQTMLWHPLFAGPELAGAINNLPEAPSIDIAISAIEESALSKSAMGLKEAALRPTQIDELRANAAYCLAVWFHETRGTTLPELNEALYRSLWSSSASTLRDERSKLRALTELRDIGGVGIACGEFRRMASDRLRQADSARVAQERAQVDLSNLKEEFRVHRVSSEEQIADLQVQLQAIKIQEEKNRKDSLQMQTHLCDDMEEMRTGVLRQLREDSRLLNEGLTALRRDPPKIAVMDDHAERVADSLLQLIKKLELGA